MSWPEVFLVLLVSHLVGDVLFQTERQAQTKVGGVASRRARRGLAAHLATYMLAFVPALVWIGAETNVAVAFAVAGLVAITHVAIDDGRLVADWLRIIKHAANPPRGLRVAVDQSFHIVCLFGAALLATI